MFGSIGWQELVLIFVIALLLFGPSKLPEIGRTIGKAMAEFRRASNDLKRTIEEEVAAADLKHVGRELNEAGRLADLGEVGRELRDAAHGAVATQEPPPEEPPAPAAKPGAGEPE